MTLSAGLEIRRSEVRIPVLVQIFLLRSYNVKEDVFLPYVRVINCRFHLLRSSAFSFSSQYLLLFLKSSISCFLLPTPFTIVICPSITNEISSQNITNPIGFSTQDTIQKCPLLSYTLKNFFISYYVLRFCVLHSPPAPHFEAFQVLPFQFSQCRGLLSHIKQ